MLINFDNTYAEELQDFYTPCNSTIAPSPVLIKFNHELATQLGINLNELSETELAAIFSGNHSLDGAFPIAQVYAGHQFGGFSQQLGDGRALLLGEVKDTEGQRFDIQLKGSGRTPYSRGGDGKSALGPVLREYIMSEAMHALGIPTTRALAAVTTGEQVMRTEPLPGGVFTRVASSHIRIGTFQYFAARQETEQVQKLADYTIARHYPHLKDSENPYLAMFAAICDAQASLVAKWMLVGFIHGVMNTDNMTISGETIDYGPCAFMDYYDPATVFSSIDRHGRYAYQNQPSIAQWNLARLAEAILPLFGKDIEKAVAQATEILENFPEQYTQYWLTGMRKKLGLQTEKEEDLSLVNDLLASMDKQKVDYTQLFRHLSKALNEDEQLVYDLFTDASDFKQWVVRWKERLSHESQGISECIQSMNQVNPLYIPRNHKVEEALEAAVNNSNYSKFEILIATLNKPFEQQVNREDYTFPAADEFNPYKTFCGT
ncbi:MAG: protein adenylyltransferase SelO [Gammaproteobacteria bacterium]